MRGRGQVNLAVRPDDPLCEGNRTDVPFADRPHRHDETDRPFGEAGLVGRRDDTGVHDRGRRIAVFVAEIGAEQLAAARGQFCCFEFGTHLLGELGVALFEDLLHLPMARVEMVIDAFEFGGDVVN